MKAVKTKLQESNPDRVETFEKGAQNFAKKIVANFKDYEFVSVYRIEGLIDLIRLASNSSPARA